MTDQAKRVKDLLPVLEAVFQAKQVRLVQINRRIRELQDSLVTLDAPKSNDLNAPATRAGADILWDTWVQDRRKLIMKEMALAARDRENERVLVAEALAKLEAARGLSARLVSEQKKLDERRASW